MEQFEIDDLVKDIRKRCRMAMDGMISAKMRDRGLVYKLNFGVSLMHLKDISARYQPNKDLAEKLWVEDVRELKILATMLYPIPDFDVETADRWLDQIPNQEIREQLTINLLQKLEYAPSLVKQWGISDIETIRTTAYWLLTRLLIAGLNGDEVRLENYPLIFSDIVCDNVSLRNSALQTLRYSGRSSESIAYTVINHIKAFQNSENLLEKEIFDSLYFEYKFYFEEFDLKDK